MTEVVLTNLHERLLVFFSDGEDVVLHPGESKKLKGDFDENVFVKAGWVKLEQAQEDLQELPTKTKKRDKG